MKTKMKTLYIPVGLPGSGKSTFVKNNLADNAYVISTDGIRGELYGDEAAQGNPKQVFMIAYNRLNTFLHDNTEKNVVFDATNLTKQARQRILSKLTKKDNIKKVCIWLDTPIDECKRRNAGRDRKVPEQVIDDMARMLVPPSFEEPFDNIVIVDKDGHFILYERDE